MKLGIVTFTYGDNYGQRLQNYAMQTLLEEYADEVYTLPQIKPSLNMKIKLKRILINLRSGRLTAMQKRAKKFEIFDLQNIHYYPECIGENVNLKTIESFDYFIVGSDQVWSPYSPDVNPSMFLAFAPKSKRLSFSPSISAEVIPDDKVDKYREYWNSLKNISVREYRGAELIKEITGKKAEVTLDPTLMFDGKFWSEKAKKPINELPSKYMLCYYLGESQNADLIDDICKKSNLKKINVLRDKHYIDIDPFEFIYLVQNASIVYTDSFHGTIFSILFKVPFVVCNRKGATINMNSRFDTLDRIFNIKNRYEKNVKIENVMLIDWDKVYYNLDLLRKKSQVYLSEILKL